MKHINAMILFCMIAGIAAAGTVDWDGTQWSKGTLTNTYNGEVTFTFSDDCDGYTSGNLILPSDDFQGLGTDWFLYNDGLWWAAKQSSITLTIAFSTPVTDVSFSMFDVDYWAPSLESLQISAANGSATVAPSVSIGSNLSYNSTTQIITGSSTGVDLTDEVTAAAARADISFTGPVDTIVLTTYGSQDQFGVIMSDMSYVPEPATMALLGLGGLLLRKRK